MPQPFPFYETRGGFRTATIFSGIMAGCGVGAAAGAVTNGPDVMFFSGQGRLNAATPFVAGGPTVFSGQPIYFYDSVTPLSGGPQSGHRCLGMIPAFNFNNSGQLPLASVFNFDVPFYSGLCAGFRSGTPAVTVVYTPEYNPLFAG